MPLAPPTEEEVEPDEEDSTLTISVPARAPAVAPAPAPVVRLARIEPVAPVVPVTRAVPQPPVPAAAPRASTPNIADMIRGTSTSAVPQQPVAARDHLQPVASVAPEESRDAFREARVLIDRWKKQSSARNPFSARSIWRRNRRFEIDKEQTGTE